MAFITRCWKSGWLDAVWPGAARCIVGLLACGFIGAALAQSNTEISQFRAERQDDDILVSAQIAFELPSAVEDALLKGIPMYFVTEADITRDRWYWYDKKVSSAQRGMRLAYQPLTRTWRVNMVQGGGSIDGQGLALSQTYESLSQALAVIKRVSRWRIADASDLDGGNKHRVEFRFRLDLGQLPRPFQIGALGQSGWDISSTLTTPLILESSK